MYENAVRNPRSGPIFVDLVALRQGRGALMAMMNMEEHVDGGGLLSRVEVFNVTLDQVDPDSQFFPNSDPNQPWTCWHP